MGSSPHLPTAPPDRNRFLDVVRSVALVRILVWHTYGYAWISYLVASMPAMFFVAGSLMAHSLSRGSALDVLYRRFRRLLIPFWVFGVAALLLMTLHGGSLPGEGRDLLWWVLPLWDPRGLEWGLTLTAPLWYLRCLTWLILASPLLLWFWRRIGPALLAVPVTAVFIFDEALPGASAPWQFKDAALFGSFWLLGFAYHDGLFSKISPAAKGGAAVFCAMAAGAWLLTQDVPESIVNLSYPMHLFVGLAWLFAALAFEGPLARAAASPRVGAAINWVNERALTIYLWQTVGLLTMYQLLWTSDYSATTRVLLGLPIVLSVVYLAIRLFGGVEDFAGRRPGLRLPSFADRRVSPGSVMSAALAGAGIAAIVVALAGIARDPSTLVQATAQTVPPSGAGLHYRAQKAEVVSGPPARPLTGRTDQVTGEELQAELEAWIAEWGLKGATVSIRRETGEAWTGAAGVDDYDNAFFPDEPYLIASVTKTFTAALVLRLVDEGYLALDDPASLYVPDFPNSDRFTVRQLLQHTSGLTSDSEEPYRALAEAATNGLQFEPGTAYLYSRAGYYLLALIVEDVSGTSFTRALHEEIIGPLELTRTLMDEEVSSTAASTHPYDPDNAAAEPEIWTQSGFYLQREQAGWDYHGALWSAGGLWSTTDDLTRWALALYDSDRVLSPATLHQMTTFLDGNYDYTGLGTYPFCTCWLDGGVLQSERWGFAGATGILEYDPTDRIALAVHMNGTLFDENVIDALDDFSHRIRFLVRGRPIDVAPQSGPAELHVYLVEEGDTLYDIAMLLGIPQEDQERWVNDVVALNELEESNLPVGAELRLP